MKNPTYRWDVEKITTALFDTLRPSLDFKTSFEIAYNSVRRGKILPRHRKIIGDEAADALNEDLKDLMI